MNKYGEVLEDGALYFVRALPGPIERVWSWIADGEKRAQWLSGGGNATKAGETIKYEFKHQNLTPHDEVIPAKYKAMESGVSYNVEITRCEPPHLMIMNWPGDAGRISEIEIRLSKAGDKVKLELFQRGEATKDEFLGASAGWHAHLDIMDDKLSGSEPKPFWATHAALMDEYAGLFAEHLLTKD